MKHAIPEHPVFRPGTVDRDIWANAIELNEYQLPDLFAPGDMVLDIGAHTGAVSWRCAMAGARVVAVEPSRENFHLLAHNLRPIWDRVTLINAAAWRSDEPPQTLAMRHNWAPANTGGSCVLPASKASPANYDVLAIPLDDVLGLHKRWRLLKIDCEGSEFFTLPFSDELDRVEEIVGEYHELHDDASIEAAGRPCTMEALCRQLEGQGFTVAIRPAADNAAMGLFWATRVAVRDRMP